MFPVASNQEPSDDFKKPSGLPPRFRKTVNNARSTLKPCNCEDVCILLKKLEERIRVLGMMCPDRPEYFAKILEECVDHFNHACYALVAERVLSENNSAACSSGGSSSSSNTSMNTRSSAAPSTPSHGHSIINIRGSKQSARREKPSRSRHLSISLEQVPVTKE